MERLHKVLAARGVASRRKAEQMIADGRVSVDGQVVRTQGFRVDPETQSIAVDGRPVRHERKRYILLNKPPGYITTAQDERGRRTVLDLVDVPERVVPVGRLDRPTSGLLLLTNDGELANRIAHPRYELEKEYEVLLDGNPPRPTLDQLARGVTIDGEVVRPNEVRAIRNEPEGTVLRIVIHEGRNRIVRRMMERIGYQVLRLTRIRLGPIVLKGIERGAWRDLTPGELDQLWEAVRAGERHERPEATERSTRRDQHRQREDDGRPRQGYRGGARQGGAEERRRKPRGQSRPVRDRDRRSGSVGQEHRRRGGGQRT
jgi:23S rRNA pseudouridine2605 synthase